MVMSGTGVMVPHRVFVRHQREAPFDYLTCATSQCGSFNPATTLSEGRIRPHRAACPTAIR